MFKPNRWVIAVFCPLWLGGLAGGSAWAQVSAGANVAANVGAVGVVVASITLAKLADINFGVVVAGPDGTLDVTPAGVNASNPAMRIAQPAAGTTGRFTVTGEGALTYIVTLPQSAALRYEQHVLELKNFQSYADGSSGQVSQDNVFSLVKGSGAFKVGATLTLPANAIPGSYSGSFPVTVAYN